MLTMCLAETPAFSSLSIGTDGTVAYSCDARCNAKCRRFSGVAYLLFSALCNLLLLVDVIGQRF